MRALGASFALRSLIVFQAKAKSERTMVSNEDFSAIAALDLDPIKQEILRSKAAKGWTPARVSTVEQEYRRFLCLAKAFPGTVFAPIVDVDEFWHYHILNTRKYARDCQSIFGYFLHHFPYAGMRGKEDEEALERAGVRTRQMYEETFAESYGSALA